MPSRNICGINIRCERVYIPRGSLFISSPIWLSYKETNNPENNDGDKCFQYSLALNQHYENKKNHQDNVSHITPIADIYNWGEINFPTFKSKSNKF